MRPRARVTGRRRMSPYVRCTLVNELPIYELRNFWVSIWRRVPIGRIDIVRGSAALRPPPTPSLPPPPRTRHVHSRGLMGIIRRYYLREGSHARIAEALPGRVPYFNPQPRRVCQPSFHPFVSRFTKAPRDSVKTGDHLALDSALSEGHQRCRNSNLAKVIIEIDVIKIVDKKNLHNLKY